VLAIADNPVVNRLEPETRDALLVCAHAIAQLEEEEQRVVIACLMAAFRLCELKPAARPH
jgi:hypothetical protein